MTIRVEKPLASNMAGAEVDFDGHILRTSTGRMERYWTWTGKGLLTTRVADLHSGAQWASDADADSAGADWLLPTVEEANPAAELVEVTCEESDDEGFTSPHLALTAEMVYRAARLALRLSVWVYPEAPGVRTQLAVRALEGFTWPQELPAQETTEESLRIARLSRSWNRVERLPCAVAGTTRRYIGLHSDLQNRNDSFTELLKEHTRSCPIPLLETCDWASIASVERDGTAISLLKESHKCVNQKGHFAGIFRLRPGVGLENLGWGLSPAEIGPAWAPSWASWCLVHGSDATARETAFKRLDRRRYPVRPEDVFLQANTWGSSMGRLQHREAASEKSVLEELAVASEMGIDLVQVDDGWQGDDYSSWRPDPARYPRGWTPLREKARELGVKLGLWAAVTERGGISTEELTRSHDEGGFVWYKLDFAHLGSHAGIQRLMRQARDLILHTGHRARVNWDNTEVVARYGFWFAREYGAIYPANRKPHVPECATYRPHTVLRDLWDLSRYANLLKFLGPVQNVDRVNPLLSDACLYPHDYCLAVSFFSLPTFFLELKHYRPEARAALRPLIEQHHRRREDIRRGITHPIGETPDGAAWTGFQNHRQEDEAGLLLIFRELANEAQSASLALHHAAGRRVTVTDLLRGSSWDAQADAQGALSFSIPETPGYRLLAYSLG